MSLTIFLVRTSLRLRDIKWRNRTLKILMLILLPGAYSASCYAQQGSTAIPVPEYTTLDALGVNVFGNSVAPTINTLSIGGGMGLSHSITVQGNIFSVYSDEHGFRDKFAGDIRSTNLGKKQGSTYDFWVLTVSAMGESAQFVELCNGKFTGSLPANSCTPTYYEAIRDKRNTLTLKYDQGPQTGPSGLHVVWTKPDGTEVYYTAGSLSMATTGGFYKIIYPNGFTINVLSSITVQTNTGFQLKYNYVYDFRAVDSTKNYLEYYGYASAISTTWWMVNPKSITAINNAYEYCDGSQRAPCTNLANNWSTVTFDWPGGMPRAFFLGKSTFRVTSPTGAIAEFNYEAQDAKVASEPANTNVAPRLMSIKPFGALKPTVSFVYSKPYHDGGGNAAYSLPAEPWILDSATGIAGSSSYASAPLYGGTNYKGYDLLVYTNDTYFPLLTKFIDKRSGREITFVETRGANLVDQDDYTSTWSKKYTYYSDNNVQTVTDKATGTLSAGGYEACTDLNRKTCNQPAWVSNNGKVTNYTYHKLSGQVETVTLPANKNGKRAQTRYEYTPLQATFLSAAGTTTGTSIYLKTAEKYCMNSNFNGAGDGNSVFSGACELGANDEVVTRYEYDITKNLHLKGKTVTAVNTFNVPTVKRTCYQYDIYGNLIGETQPNANPASCN